MNARSEVNTVGGMIRYWLEILIMKIMIVVVKGLIVMVVITYVRNIILFYHLK